MTNDNGGFPVSGRGADLILEEIDAIAKADIDWRGGRAFSLVYHPDDAELERLQEAVGRIYLHENALNPFKYPSLVQMEQDLVGMAADLFHEPTAGGSLSSGGTESIFLAIHTARSWAEQRGVTTPNIITPDTVHPAFPKACHYLGVEHRKVAVGPDQRADVAGMTAAIDANTVLLVGSAPCYPFGVIDPIPELASVAIAHEILSHVDACLGGWMLPWWERLGESVPPWDFRVPGVTSISADIHKYGYTFKGASLVLYRDPAMVQHQWFLYDEWQGGLYGSITTAGTRPAAPIAGAWATVRFLGADGYLAKAEMVRDATRAFQVGIAGIDGLVVTGSPNMSVFEFGAEGADGDTPAVDIGAVGDVMDDRGWNLDRQPGGLHLMVSPYHVHMTKSFLADLADAVAIGGTSRGKAAGYGGIAGHEG